MSKAKFEESMGKIAAAIGDRPVDGTLAAFLNQAFAAEDAAFRDVEALCREGEADGWLCEREMGGIKFGRVIKPGGAAGRFSVDVVRMKDVKGPHHVHPTGEIGMIMPVAGDPEIRRGWARLVRRSAGLRPLADGHGRRRLRALPAARRQDRVHGKVGAARTGSCGAAAPARPRSSDLISVAKLIDLSVATAISSISSVTRPSARPMSVSLFELAAVVAVRVDVAEQLDHVVERGALGVAREAVAALGAAHRLHQPGAAEVAQHLGEVVGGNPVHFGDLGDRQLARGIARQLEGREQGEAGGLLELHRRVP